MPLTPHGSRSAKQAAHESNVRHSIDLVDSYGLSTGDRINLAQELHQRAVSTRDNVRDITDVWREGLRAD